MAKDGTKRDASGSRTTAAAAKTPAARARVLGKQGERTRQRLLEAAKEIFRERGYPSTRVDDITKKAGTSHGAFYLYFPNKAEALEALAATTAERMYRLAEEFGHLEPGEEGYEQLRRWIDSFIATYEEEAPVIVAWMSARPEDERFDRLGREVLRNIGGRIASTIHRAIGDDALHPVNPGIAATALVAMLERFCFFWLVRGAEFKRDDVVDTFAALWHSAIFGQSHRA